MPQPNFMLLYVDSPHASARFYAGLLGCEPVETSPTFVLFALKSGLKLGLWARHLVEPAVSAAPGAAEIAIPVEGPAAVDSTHAAWQARGLHIIQAPTDMDFGQTFVALDPDGHRLRVFAPSGQ
jgi:catechol 2,3-dioxygenase-like lactoylglutathione lyase family enzyme